MAAVVEVVKGRLIDQSVAALVLSANNLLQAGGGWSLEVEKVAGRAYRHECRDLAAVGPGGLALGSAVVTGGGKLAQGELRRCVIQAITTGYVADSRPADQRRIPATPGVLYAAVRAALEKAELYRMDSVATYVMVQRPGYATRPPGEMAETLFRALLDHAAIASAVQRIVVCEEKDAAVADAQAALARAQASRV